ncbi:MULTISPECIES: response regulator transcription factor [unclassified Lactococcus]|uniref:response regulator transcription factor n=1 Tax=unclassified Lactococcus TaxID=2643510 RepID=UPI0011CA0688|nr:MULTISPECIES: response regulator transcription factor [unclassified Lactococcus]MQW22724.1 response regulator [Lactococcus sp. dk101]TXK44730.1 response regulator transcription factor [Lactococcus sp. dk310]TXK50624.1 response regulator transcription factor [Lactococcus sp. dk322]
MKRQVLIVEDERSISSYVKKELMFEDYDVQTAFDGVEALEKFENANPAIDVVLLDWMIPKIDGLGVLRRMKKIQPNTPIIFLTARDYVGDKVAGLDAGADDYITKPFEIEELLARLRLIFRKWSAERATIYRVDYLSLDTTAHVVTANGKPISLTQREYALLLFFMQHRGEAISRADLLDEVWGMNFDGQDNTVDAYVRYLRSKIDEPDTASLIETVRGVGYRMR